MDNILISICIPTFNRARFLKECLESITNQFSNPEVKNNVNITILDNQSEDNTEEVAKSFTSKYDNVQYLRDNEKRGLIPGIIKVASLADGKYIWVFSDDDVHSSNSLEIAINFIKQYQTDLILGNLIGFSDNNNIKYKNLLKVNENLIANNKKEFFAIINKRFPRSIDYYTTLCSNWIIKKDIFDNNFSIFKKFNDKFDLFPFPSLFFYTNMEFSSGIIAQEIVLNRGENESWGRKNKIKHFFYRDRLWRDYYQKIINNNRGYLPKNFSFKVKIKNIVQYKELVKIILHLFF
jgi:abequosyltransferase